VRQQSAFTNPVLVGAVTVLVTLVAVFLSYNANQGLPFVPTKELKVDIANGAQLVPGNDVREGGYRIGAVTDMKPIRLPNGQIGGQVTAKLDQSTSDVPVDSTASVRPRSVLGLKYLDLEKGKSKKLIPDGGTLPLSQTRVPVQFDDLNKIFDSHTRVAVQKDLQGFGDVLAARGSSLNDTIAALPDLLRHLEPVARYLSDPSTELTRFLGALNGFFSTVSPVSEQNWMLFRDQARTFAAIVRDPNAYEQTIRESPPTLEVSTDSLRFQQPFLVDLTTVSNDLRPGTAALRDALPTLNSALVAGVQVLPRTPPMNAKLQKVLSALQSLAKAPESNMALNGLTQTVGTLNPQLRYLGPFQTVCDNWNYWWTYLSEHISEATSFGYAQRALIMGSNHQPNNVGQQGATEPANGYGPPGYPPMPDQPDAEYIHGQPYGAAVDNRGNADCEIGQRGYPKKLNYFDPKGRMLVTDNHTPGNQGPTYHGRPRVPTGETFTRNPSPMTIPFLGSKQPVPSIPFNPTNP
jgi:virulence factor Mce-like protein